MNLSYPVVLFYHKEKEKIMILYKGKDVLKMNKKELRQFRGKEISYIFQDPMTSLNPTMRIGKQIEEVFVGRKGMSAAEKKAKALEILKMVGIS